MISEHIHFKDSGYFPPIFCDYIDQIDTLKSFTTHPPTIDGLLSAIQSRDFTSSQRELLITVLQNQYSGIELSDAVAKNIELLKETNTFTVTTGHQLSLLGGPLFWIYKLITAIRLTERLKKEFPEYSFVPIYWLASEDHDFEEIRTVRFFGKDYQWEEQQKGPLGRVSPSSLAVLFEQFPEHISEWEKVYKTSSTLAEATRKLAHLLLGDRGLLVLDPDDVLLKKQLIPVIKDDLFRHSAHEKVQKTGEELLALGYTPQVHVREVNLFYIDDGLRERIVQEGKEFRVLNTTLTFSESEINSLAEQNPEKFSPNVVLRPIYQQIVLPNVAYVGGPAEIAYWLQLKGIFDHYGVNYPVLFPRFSAVLLRRQISDKMSKLGISANDVFQGKEFLKNKILKRFTVGEIDFSEQQQQLENVFTLVRQKAEVVDKTLSAFVGAEEAKALKILEYVLQRIRKAEEQKHETELRQADAVYDAFFPLGTMQERKEGLLGFYINNSSIITQLLENNDPFNFFINILVK